MPQNASRLTFKYMAWKQETARSYGRSCVTTSYELESRQRLRKGQIAARYSNTCKGCLKGHSYEQIYKHKTRDTCRTVQLRIVARTDTVSIITAKSSQEFNKYQYTASQILVTANKGLIQACISVRLVHTCSSIQTKSYTENKTKCLSLKLDSDPFPHSPPRLQRARGTSVY